MIIHEFSKIFMLLVMDMLNKTIVPSLQQEIVLLTALTIMLFLIFIEIVIIQMIKFIELILIIRKPFLI